MKSNTYSPLAESAIDRVRQITNETVTSSLAPECRKRFLEELKFHGDTLKSAFEYRKLHGPERSMADSDAYFREKLGALLSFAQMAVDPALREDYSPLKIVDNVSHYSYLVAKLTATSVRSTTTRPATEKALSESSYEHHDALKRLVNR